MALQELPQMFKMYEISGYSQAIMSLRMSKGEFYSFEKAQQIQDLVYVMVNQRGLLCTREEHFVKCQMLGINRDLHGKSNHPKVSGHFDIDREEFKRLLGMTMNQAMGESDHHTLMKYIDVSFFTEGFHRGGQDDLDAHAMGFNNRITRFSTRLANISDQQVSEWYKDKIIPFHDVLTAVETESGQKAIPDEFIVGDQVFNRTPFGYVLKEYEELSDNSGLRKDVVRGLMGLATPGCALWKCDIFNLRYIYSRRSKLTKANPELKIGMEQLFDQLESIPVFGEHVRHELTDTGTWEHINRVRTCTTDEYELLKAIREGRSKVVFGQQKRSPRKEG